MVYWLSVDNRRVNYRVFIGFIISFCRNPYFSQPTYHGSKQFLVFNFRCSVDSKNLDQQKGGLSLMWRWALPNQLLLRVVMETL